MSVTITRVRALVTESEEGLEALGESTADLYAEVTINGSTQSTFDIHQDDTPDISPFWVFSNTVPSSTANIPVVIKIFDHDSTSPDDQADADPGGGVDSDLTVNMATGTWSGDTTSTCTSGTGDEGVFLCFSISVLSASGDADGDGLLDGWETVGLDTDGGGIDVNLPAMGADPRRKDIFIEVDCLVASDHSHCPIQNAISDVVAAFANAPVANIDGTTGIQLHVDVGPLYGTGIVTTIVGSGGVVASYGDLGGGGNQIPEAGNTIIDWDGATGNPATNYFTLKGANFDAHRAFAYRYNLFAHQTNARAAANDCTSGWAEGITGNDFIVTLGGVGSTASPCWGTDVNGFSVGTRAEQAGTFMHELGHVIGLDHGGGDGVNNKPHYLSVMNYNWQACSVPASPSGTLPGACDYSRIDLPDLNELGLDECIGIDGGLGFGPTDWDGDGNLEGVTLCQAPFATNSQADINVDGICVTPGTNGTLESTASVDDVPVGANIRDGANFTCNSTASGPDDVQNRPVGSVQPNPLTGFDDWQNIAYVFRTQANFQNGITSPVPEEATPEDIARSGAELGVLLAPAVQVVKTGPATVLPGQTITYAINVSNSGRGPALLTALTDTLPNGTGVSFSLGAVVVGQLVTNNVNFSVPANACPSDLINTAQASFTDMAGNALTSVATPLVTKVLDITPPVLSVGVSPTTLSPSNHKLATINATIAVTDECDPNPQVQLVSIASNEPDNGLGDGDVPLDIQGAALGSDDRQFLLRKERGGTGSGRVYTITYQASDFSGNVTIRTATVTVPHN